MPRVQFNANVYHPNSSPKCPVCMANADIYRRKDTGNFEGWCDVCGNVLITQPAVERVRQGGRAYLLSRWLSTHSESGLIDIPQLEDILRNAPSHSVLEKLDFALDQIASMTRQPGQFTAFDYSKHYPLIYAVSPEEAQFYLHELHNLGYVDRAGSMTHAKVTAKGYTRLQEIQRTGKQSDNVFVAMWFDERLQQLYDGAIAPAISEAGYKPVLMKNYEHVNRIDDEIISQIRKSRFMVADFTGQRGGVYFEAGYMLGQGRNVFWMCEKAQLKQLHFDTRQYNFIDYASVDEARKRLHFRIMAIEGQGPHAVT